VEDCGTRRHRFDLSLLILSVLDGLTVGGILMLMLNTMAVDGLFISFVFVIRWNGIQIYS
jgi:hypothetical protein